MVMVTVHFGWSNDGNKCTSNDECGRGHRNERTNNSISSSISSSSGGDDSASNVNTSSSGSDSVYAFRSNSDATDFWRWGNTHQTV